jgi:hypothetical protein
MTECHKKVLGRQRKAAKANHPQSKTTNKHNATKAILDSERTKGDTESANGEEAKLGREAGSRRWTGGQGGRGKCGSAGAGGYKRLSRGRCFDSHRNTPPVWFTVSIPHLRY